MGPKTDSKEIGGRKFTVTALSGWSSFKTSRRLAALLGPAAGALFSEVGGAESLGDMEVTDLLKGLGPGMEALFSRLTETELVEVTKLLLATATVEVEGKAVKVIDGFDLLFHGQSAQVWALLIFAVEVNYGDFSELLGGLVRRFATEEKKESDSTSPTA